MTNELASSDSALMSAYVTCAGSHGLPKVLALDEHQILLDTMDAMFSGRFQFKGVTTHLEFMYALEMFQPDVIVMDVTVQGRDGISFLEKLRASRKDLRVIFLSQHDDPRCVAMASEVGAMAYLTKRRPGNELIRAIEAVLNGEHLLQPKEFNTRSYRSRGLTPRQVEVLRLIARGMSAKQMAQELKISVRTAEFHRLAIMQRLDLHSTAEMTRYAISEGLV